MPPEPPALSKYFLLPVITIKEKKKKKVHLFFFEITDLELWHRTINKTTRMMVWFHIGRLITDPSFKKNF